MAALQPCSVCPTKTNLTCAKCHAVYFCSPDCQKALWKTHDMICGQEDKTVFRTPNLTRKELEEHLCLPGIEMQTRMSLGLGPHDNVLEIYWQIVQQYYNDADPRKPNREFAIRRWVLRSPLNLRRQMGVDFGVALNAFIDLGNFERITPINHDEEMFSLVGMKDIELRKLPDALTNEYFRLCLNYCSLRQQLKAGSRKVKSDWVELAYLRLRNRMLRFREEEAYNRLLSEALLKLEINWVQEMLVYLPDPYGNPEMREVASREQEEWDKARSK